MVVDIKKFKSLQYGSHYYSNWDDQLHRLMDEIGSPTYHDGVHFWFVKISKTQSGYVGFDDNGNFCHHIFGKTYKDPNKAILTREEAEKFMSFMIEIIQALDKYGLVVSESEDRYGK